MCCVKREDSENLGLTEEDRAVLAAPALRSMGHSCLTGGGELGSVGCCSTLCHSRVGSVRSAGLQEVLGLKELSFHCHFRSSWSGTVQGRKVASKIN